MSDTSDDMAAGAAEYDYYVSKRNKHSMENNNPIIFPDGFFFEKRKDNAPESLKGKISINVPKALETLKKYQNNAGYVTLDMWKSKEKGNIFLAVNTFKPEKKEEPADDEVIGF